MEPSIFRELEYFPAISDIASASGTLRGRPEINHQGAEKKKQEQDGCLSSFDCLWNFPSFW